MTELPDDETYNEFIDNIADELLQFKLLRDEHNTLVVHIGKNSWHFKNTNDAEAFENIYVVWHEILRAMKYNVEKTCLEWLDNNKINFN